MTNKNRALDLVLAEPWAISQANLEQILAIAQRMNESPEAVAAKLGRPLENSRSVELRGTTAVVPVIGPIFRYANMFTQISGATSLELLAKDFNLAVANPNVKSIVLNIDSPGGQATGISEFAEMVRSASKPVTAYVGGTSASAAYWISAAADRIVTSDTGILGSIGVVASFRPSKDGQIKIISSQSPLKQADPTTEAGRAEVQRIVDDLAAVFVVNVAAYRGVDTKTVTNKFGRGGLLVGINAVAAGMADGIGTFESLLAGLSGSNRNRGILMNQQSNQNSDAIAEFDAAVAELTATGMKKGDAMTTVIHGDPELHARYLEAVNANT